MTGESLLLQQNVPLCGETRRRGSGSRVVITMGNPEPWPLRVVELSLDAVVDSGEHEMMYD
ncbi:MAG: hypothetical protein ACYCQM_01425 [Acidithiobacillus sp.]